MRTAAHVPPGHPGTGEGGEGVAVFTLTIAGHGDALDQQPETEVARMLRAAADKVEQGQQEGPMLDINGNSVGAWRWHA